MHTGSFLGETPAAGRITAKELPIATDERQRTDKIRIAPGFTLAQTFAGDVLPPKAYTVQALATFLGEIGPDNFATDSFKATFGALELIAGNKLKESLVAGLEVWKIDYKSVFPPVPKQSKTDQL